MGHFETKGVIKSKYILPSITIKNKYASFKFIMFLKIKIFSYNSNRTV